MPAKRSNPKQRENRITPEAVAAFHAGDWMALHRALGLRPWEVSPLDAGREPPLRDAMSMRSLTWSKAKALRDLLEGARHGDG